MVWSSLRETCSTKSSLANIWLDIANGYESIPQDALERYALIPIGFPLSKYTTQEFIALLFLSLPQSVGISISTGFLLDALFQQLLFCRR